MRRGNRREDDPSTMIAGSLGAIFFGWLGTSLLVVQVTSDSPAGKPSVWLIVIALYVVTGYFVRDVVRRWRSGERIGLRPSGPILATIELVIGLSCLVGALFPVAYRDIRAIDLIGLAGGLVLTTSATIGFLAFTRRRQSPPERPI